LHQKFVPTEIIEEAFRVIQLKIAFMEEKI